MPVGRDKDSLRRRARAARRQLPVHRARAAGEAIAGHLVRWVRHERLRAVALFWPLPGEPRLQAALVALFAGGTAVYLPRMERALGVLRFSPWSPALRPTRSGRRLWQPPSGGVGPQRLDAIVLPGLAFDRVGHRLGSGGGWYDRTLAAPGGPRRVGVAYPEQVGGAALPAEAWDVRVERIFTPRGGVACRADAPCR